MRIVFLTDNIEKDDIKGEWGLSVYIEYEGHRILLDAGQSDLFLKNAEKLGVDISSVDTAVLSHAHYDHADGFLKFFEANKEALLYVRNSTDENCYKKLKFFHKYIGIEKGLLSLYMDRIRYVEGEKELFKGCFLAGHTTNNLSELGKREKMYRRCKNKWIVDDFSHEQSLIFDTEKGLVIFNSCCHGGAYNVVNEVKELFGDKEVYAIIGGFHLFNKSSSEIETFVKALTDTGVKKVITGHCTGERAFGIIKESLGEKAELIHSGLSLEI